MMNAEAVGGRFTDADVYAHEATVAALYPTTISSAQDQTTTSGSADRGWLEFNGRGDYRRTA